jgi:integrase
MKCWTPDQLVTSVETARAERLGALWSLPPRRACAEATFSACAGQTWTSDAGRLTVGSTRSRAGDTIIETDPKTERSRRTVSLDARTVAGLRALRRTQPEETLALSTGWTEDALVAVDELGEPIYPRRWSRSFTVLARPAGLPLIRLHDLRHTTVTGALGAGVPVEVVSRRVGHADVLIRLKTYRHVLEGDDAAAAEVLGALLRRGTPGGHAGAYPSHTDPARKPN